MEYALRGQAHATPQRQDTHQHLPDHCSRCEPDDEADKHTCEYGDEGLMYRTNAADLKVVRCPQGKDKQEADEEEGPGGVEFFLLDHGRAGQR